ncbi:MAG: glycoside hydrolase family 5 protein [Ruminococcaceae bacterium]|nr:glycoside hydrolase family 5 protein [Oscillospiraceae bacterium]
MKKRFISIILAAAVGISVTATGCNNTEEGNNPQDSTISHQKEIADITAMELYEKMTVGWNLGNSLDAVGSGLSSETAWGNPKTEKELIDAVKEAGFDVVRIPVTWMGHFDNETYTIDTEWLARVKEVVDYVIDNDMYAVINIHHDGNDTAQSWLTPAPSDEDSMVSQFETLWKQIAEYFNEYDEHLMFAGMNEFHKGYSNPSSEYLRITDRLNQSFVETVRATGGNNEKRILIVQAYNTNGDASLKMTVPTDTVSDKLMVEIHFYDPWNFAGEGKGDWGKTGTNTDSWGQEDWVYDIFGRIKAKFVDNNIPVILGEYGAVNNKNGNDDHRRYYVEYVTKAAKENGILPIWWDNGNDSGSGEAFSLFNRYMYTKLHEDIHGAIMRGVSGEDYTIELP